MDESRHRPNLPAPASASSDPAGVGADPRSIRIEALSRGIVTGPAAVHRAFYGHREVSGAGTDFRDEKERIGRFDAALRRTSEQIAQLIDDESSDFADVISLIFSAHRLMLEDEAFSDRMRDLIRSGRGEEDAITKVVEDYAAQLSAVADLRIAEKADDVRDLGYRLLRNLSGDTPGRRTERGSIVVLEQGFPSDIARAAIDGAAGVVLFGSTPTAHATILAKSVGIPVAISHDPLILEIEDGSPLTLNASEGELRIVAPQAPLGEAPVSPADIPFIVCGSVGGDTAGEGSGPVPFPTGGVTTRCGVRVHVQATVNIMKEAREAALLGADGIGLYRSEFPFILRAGYLSEEEQYAQYRRIFRYLPDGEITFRTADIGGDKLVGSPAVVENNPFLGVRGIRFSLSNRGLFREQLRAALRAGREMQLRIMFPMVSSAEEVLEAKELAAEVLDELRREGVPHNPHPAFGAMIELPSAALSVRELLAVSDFASIGMNDLVMYLLAVDRTNTRLSWLYQTHHPIVLRLLAKIVEDAGTKADVLSVCGESASDPLMVAFFLGIGLRRFSVPPAAIAPVREFVSGFDLGECVALSRSLLEIDGFRDMDRYVREFRTGRGAGR